MFDDDPQQNCKGWQDGGEQAVPYDEGAAAVQVGGDRLAPGEEAGGVRLGSCLTGACITIQDVFVNFFALDFWSELS